jgi:hypothetical protein
MGAAIGSTLGNNEGSIRGALLVVLTAPAVEGREKLSESTGGSKLERDFEKVSLLIFETLSASSVLTN